MLKQIDTVRFDVENKLSEYLLTLGNPDANKLLLDSVNYSLLDGGKRIRGILLIEFFKLFSEYSDAVLPFACAVEMVHAASLIHDDLPCMDNSKLRRGKPSNHVVFGEAVATVAGDALLVLAFYVMGCEETVNGVGYKNSVLASRILSHAIGINGMTSGQVADLYPEKTPNFDVMNMYINKTAKLISASTQIGAIISGARDTDVEKAKKFGELIGLEYQLIDDLLDYVGDEKTLGKPTKKDIDNHRTTYMSIYGESVTLERIQKLNLEVLNLLDTFSGDTTFLKQFTDTLSRRVF